MQSVDNKITHHKNYNKRMIILHFFSQEDWAAGLSDFLKTTHAVSAEARRSEARWPYIKIHMVNLCVTVKKIVPFGWLAPGNNLLRKKELLESSLFPSGLLLVLSWHLISFCLLSIVSLLPSLCLRISGICFQVQEVISFLPLLLN